MKYFAKIFSLGAPEESVAEQVQGYKEQNQPLAKNYPLLSHIERQMLPAPPQKAYCQPSKVHLISPLAFFRQPSCASARRRLIKWKLHSFCIPVIVRRRPSLGLSPLGVAWPTETTAHKAY